MNQKFKFIIFTLAKSQELAMDNGARLMGACLSRLQSKLTYKWDSEILVTVAYKMYEVVHGVNLKKYLKYDVFLQDKVRDTRQNYWTMKYRSQ